jgi:hypothetical protein
MAQFYNPKRNPDWNYGGKNWRLSRSKIDLFQECPRCFYLDNKYGVARPKGFPFNLNSAVDTLLKKEFDIHRAAQTSHPLMKSYGLEAVPFADARIDEWRDALKRGIRFLHTPTKLLVSGGVDDVWINPKGELIIVDYKATAKDGEVNLDADWQDGYRRQIEVYQWLFRSNGFKVSDTGYFVYVNGQTDRAAFDGKLEFDVKLIPYTGNTDWIEPTLFNIKKCLEDKRCPSPSKTCDYCTYRLAVHGALVKAKEIEKPKKVSGKNIEDTSDSKQTLF